ncbi:MAG: C25 family cysteine peptidase [Ignavibacteriaceae bacterium]|nr:C25 family cysteine peptidase [Ignavibacteriaceae bacterium]
MNGRFLVFFLFLQVFSHTAFSQYFTVKESGNQSITLEFDFRGKFSVRDTLIDGARFDYIAGEGHSLREIGEPWLPQVFASLAIPFGSNPELITISSTEREFSQKFILPYPDNSSYFGEFDLTKFNQEVYSRNKFFPARPVKLEDAYTMRYSRILPVSVSPFRYNPVSRVLTFTEKITIKINYNAPVSQTTEYINDPMTLSFLESAAANYSVGKRWIGKELQTAASPQTTTWFDPQKEYFKIYLKEKGVYRITYEELVTAGFPSTGTDIYSLELFNNGVQIPIEVVSAGDTVFNSGDYIQFAGYPAPASPHVRQNIYNLSNVYWLSYQGQSRDFFYRYKSSRPTIGDNILVGYIRSDYYEKDSIYERLGYALNDQRDYWYWGRAAGYRRIPTQQFQAQFQPLHNYNMNFPQVRLRVNMHGMTESSCLYSHNVKIVWNEKELGRAKWSGQEAYTYDRYFVISTDSFNIYPSGNYLKVIADGLVCHPDSSDEIRVNWFEISYYSDNRVLGNSYMLNNSSSQTGNNIFRIWQWQDTTMKVFSPSQKVIINDPQYLNDADRTVLFSDSATTVQDYFLVGHNVFRTVDSIRKDISVNLRAASNAADYLIITHPEFLSVAERLKSMRQTDFPDKSIPNPRIAIVDVLEIYDEFSAGLLEPAAIQRFIKHVFENWARPAATHVVLVGDMSYDYRMLRNGSRRNFIPSMPHHSYTYGQAASDNLFVSVAGTDVIPDLTIGRLSMETIAEGNVLLDKLEAYPNDAGKKWKETIIFMASGLSNEDENRYGFNDASMYLFNQYIKPGGFDASRIFAYPNRPEHMIFKGGTYEIRSAFNTGAAIANYYGHGGGYQWDETFLNDDIYLLQNGGRLPVIISVTCYTAHFDNQDVFGEQFNKVQGKGSIAFFGSSGLTHWDIGKFINNLFFREVFTNKNYSLGKSIMFSKAQTPPVGYYANQIALLTLLGDPVLQMALPTDADFSVRPSDFSLSNSNPVLGDSIDVKIKLQNYGISKNDSVLVELFFSNQDTTGFIASQKIPVFGNTDSVTFNWKPYAGGLFNLIAKINLNEQITELDYTDNEAAIQMVVFNINNPSILYPLDGKRFTNGNIRFSLSDYGLYLGRDLDYFIEIDTSLTFSNPIITTPALSAEDGLVNYNAQLPNGSYFWRARIFDGENFGRWTAVRTLSVGTDAKDGFYLSNEQLQLFNRENVNYISGNQTLALNVTPLPPKPQINRLLSEFKLDSTVSFNLGLSCIATDGKYFYVSNLWYWMLTLYGDSTGRTRIYKFGTGNEGTVEGQYYGMVPGFHHRIGDQMTYHSDGYLYFPISTPYKVLRVHPETGVTDSIDVPAGLIEKTAGKVAPGSYYLASDSQFVYNLAIRDSLNRPRYTLRIFDPSNNWEVVAEHFYENISSFQGFTNFFVADGYFYPAENYISGYLRRIRIDDGYFDAEWIPWFVEDPNQHIRYYAWTYDWKNNHVYASVYRPGVPRIGVLARYPGRYLDANGVIASPEVGPAKEWKRLHYLLENQSATTHFTPILYGYDRAAKKWDTLAVDFASPLDLSGIDPLRYTSLKMNAKITDSAYTIVNPLSFRELQVDYTGLPELLWRREAISFAPDSLLQGLDIVLNAKLFNYGEGASDTVRLKFYLNDEDDPFYTVPAVIPGDSSFETSASINTSQMIFDQTVRAAFEHNGQEYYGFNNLLSGKFFVARDSVNPNFNITIDGKEIINGDIISKRPEIVITLRDNSPLPLDTTLFTLIYDNIPMSYYRDKINFEYTPYPNSEAKLTWKPTLTRGRHTLDVLAKDASGNFFDSTYKRTVFFVYDVDDIDIIYNYPNPFSSDTYFTFELRGTNTPDEIKIKIFTVAGRQIKEFTIDKSQYAISFNKIYWDGRDQDGDEIANGVYFYKMITKYGDKTKETIKKLVKMK